MVLATAARSVAGKAAERLEVVPLPGPVAWENIDQMDADVLARWPVRTHRAMPLHRLPSESSKTRSCRCSMNAPSSRTSSALPTTCSRSATSRKSSRRFGWEQSSELVFNLGAKLVGRRRGEPERFRRDAVDLMTSMVPSIEASNPSTNSVIEYDEDAFVTALLSVNIQKSFEAVSAALKAGVKLDRLITTLVLLAADRMARTPVNVDAGWGVLTMELNLAASLRTAQRHGGDRVAAKGLFHAAWQVFADRWLNIPVRPLTAPLGGGKLDVPDEDAGVQVILKSIASLNVQDVGRQVLEYLNSGYSGDRLLHEMGRVMLWDDTNTQVLPTLRTVFEEWERSGGSDPALGAGHPARISCWSASPATLRTFARTKTADPRPTPPCGSRKERQRWKCLTE